MCYWFFRLYQKEDSAPYPPERTVLSKPECWRILRWAAHKRDPPPEVSVALRQQVGAIKTILACYQSRTRASFASSGYECAQTTGRDHRVHPSLTSVCSSGPVHKGSVLLGPVRARVAKVLPTRQSERRLNAWGEEDEEHGDHGAVGADGETNTRYIGCTCVPWKLRVEELRRGRNLKRRSLTFETCGLVTKVLRAFLRSAGTL